MQALVMMAHGSRREAANVEFRDTATRVGAAIGGHYDRTECAFLDGVSPSLEEAVGGLIAAGAINIDVYPFFLNTGKHADQDIPALVENLKVANPNCGLRVLDYVGKSSEMVDLCVRHILAQSL
jgi:sirohydrochlorin ferrochelatase